MKNELFNSGDLVKTLLRSELSDALARHVGQATPANLVTENYRMFRNPANGLEYAEPLVPGNDEFYQWLGKFAWYYPRHRWEYEQIKKIAYQTVRKAGRASLVDVGCGSGEFLALVASSHGLEHLGIEPSKLGCEKCTERGLNIFNGGTGEFLASNPSKRFDVVCSFHTLEHVPNPVDFVRELVRLAHSDGIVCISTPLSPMFFECVWFDVLNHPPHHLTRWTIAAYKSLALEIGLEISFAFPKPISLPRQIWASCELVNFGPSRRVTPGRRIAAILRTPLKTLSIAWKLMRQRRLHPETKWDSVLVLLTAANREARS